MARRKYKRHKLPDTITRFWSKVSKTDTCWLWTGARSDKGYGGFKFNGIMVPAHRLVWKLTKGKIPPGMDVAHTCEVRHCMNPEHLFLRTARTRTLAAIRKEGGHCKIQKLSMTDAEQIRLKYQTGQYSYQELANEFKISITQIFRIIHCHQWNPAIDLQPAI